MSNYHPEYQITDEILVQAAAVAELVGQIEARHLTETSPLLCGGVCSAAEGYPDPVRQLHAALKQMDGFDLFSMYDMKQAGSLLHGGGAPSEFRKAEGGVFSGSDCILLAPPARLVPGLLRDLLGWMKNGTDSVHPLIASAVFHYELLYIQPFAENNALLAQLWHAAMLAQWKPVFAALPLLLPVDCGAAVYYDALRRCRAAESAGDFIAFTLTHIRLALQTLLPADADAPAPLSKYVKRLLAVTQAQVPYTAVQLLELLHLRSRETLRRNYLDPALALGLFRMEFPQTPRSRNQRYIKG